MQKAIEIFHIAEYAILVFDTLPHDFSKIRVNGKTYEVTIPYDIPNSIAIKSSEDFNDSVVEFL